MQHNPKSYLNFGELNHGFSSGTEDPIPLPQLQELLPAGTEKALAVMAPGGGNMLRLTKKNTKYT